MWPGFHISMSKKVARTIDDWGGRSTRRRRRVRPHVLRAARHAFVLILVGIPAGVYLLQYLYHWVAAGRSISPW
jgi:hypothetical protein